MLDQQPGFICTTAIGAGPHQYPRPAQLLALQSKFQITFSESILDIVALRELFPDGKWKVNLLCNLGYGDQSKLFPRNPRLEFEEASVVL
jgi:hypothetical protein